LTRDACAGIVSDMETDYFEDELADACGARGCYPDRRCAKCRLADGESCEVCGLGGDAVGGIWSEVVLCAGCKAVDDAEAWEEPVNPNNTPRLAPLVAEPPTETISAIAACIVSAYGKVRPFVVDPDEVTAVTVVARLAGGAR
jgi:hypothetical protein